MKTLLIILVLLLIILLSKKMFKRVKHVKPKNLIPLVLGRYEKATESEIAEASRQLSKIDPLNPDRALLYALRVSKCVPNLKSLKTLASRYAVAHCGAGARGLELGKESQHYQTVANFLAKRYLKRFKEISNDILAKAEKSSQLRKTEKAKANVWLNANDKIINGYREFTYDLLGLADYIEEISEYCDKQASMTNNK